VRLTLVTGRTGDTVLGHHHAIMLPSLLCLVALSLVSQPLTEATQAHNAAFVSADQDGNVLINSGHANGTMYIDGIDIKQTLLDMASALASQQQSLLDTALALASQQDSTSSAAQMDANGNVMINSSQSNATVFIDGIDVKKSLVTMQAKLDQLAGATLGAHHRDGCG